MTKDIEATKRKCGKMATKTKRITKVVPLSKKVDPGIYYHVKTLNKLGVKTEYSCAAIGKSITYCGDIITKEDHGDNSNFPYIISTNNLNNKCQCVLGLILFNSPDVLYCKKSKSFYVENKCVFGNGCCCDFQTEKSGDSIYENHKFFRLIDIYNIAYDRKIISFDRNLESFLYKMKNYDRNKITPILYVLFLNKLHNVLENIVNSNIIQYRVAQPLT